MESITKLLHLTPNLHTLRISFSDILRTREQYVLFKEKKTFQVVSNTNHIKVLLIDDMYLTLEEIKLFIDLCPRIEHLTICIEQNFLQRALQFLLSKNNTKARHLTSLFIDRTPEVPGEMLKALIESENLQVDYIIGNGQDERIHNIYLWL